MIACVGLHRPPDDAADDWAPPAATVGYLCDRCRNRLSSLLVAFPHRDSWLTVNVAAGGGPPQDRISGSREDPIPLRQDVLDLIGPTSRKELSTTMANLGRARTYRSLRTDPDRRWQLWAGVQYVASFPTEPDALAALEEITEPDRDAGYYQVRLAKRMRYEQAGDPQIAFVLRSWAKIVHEESYADWPDRTDVPTICRWLTRKVNWIAGRPWVDDMLRELVDMSWRAFWLAPDEAEQRLLEPPCPSCDLRALMFTRGVGVECETRMGGCGRSWTDADFDRLVIVLGSEAIAAREAS